MNNIDEITLKAFLIALIQQLDEPLPGAVQTELKEIAKNIDLNLGKLDAIARENLKQYKNIRISLDDEYATRSKSSAVAIKPTSSKELESSLNLSNKQKLQSKEVSQQLKSLFDRTQAIPGVQDLTEAEITEEIKAYREGE
jgi:hypothetical protein